MSNPIPDTSISLENHQHKKGTRWAFNSWRIILWNNHSVLDSIRVPYNAIKRRHLAKEMNKIYTLDKLPQSLISLLHAYITPSDITRWSMRALQHDHWSRHGLREVLAFIGDTMK